MKSLAQARVKRARAVELAVEGHSYEEIAQRVGYSNRGSAHRAVFCRRDPCTHSKSNCRRASLIVRHLRHRP